MKKKLHFNGNGKSLKRCNNNCGIFPTDFMGTSLFEFSFVNILFLIRNELCKEFLSVQVCHRSHKKYTVSANIAIFIILRAPPRAVSKLKGPPKGQKPARVASDSRFRFTQDRKTHLMILSNKKEYLIFFK